jgi:hypothetical protein
MGNAALSFRRGMVIGAFAVLARRQAVIKDASFVWLNMHYGG